MSKIIFAIAMLVSVPAFAKDKGINTNSKPVIIYEETFEVFCEHEAHETTCVEIVTSGAHEGEVKIYFGPGSLLTSKE